MRNKRWWFPALVGLSVILLLSWSHYAEVPMVLRGCMLLSLYVMAYYVHVLFQRRNTKLVHELLELDTLEWSIVFGLRYITSRILDVKPQLQQLSWSFASMNPTTWQEELWYESLAEAVAIDKKLLRRKGLAKWPLIDVVHYIARHTKLEPEGIALGQASRKD